MEVRINGVLLTHQEGIVVKDIYGESLNSGYLKIPNVEKMTLTPFKDEVTISYDSKTYYFLVGRYQTKTTSMKPTHKMDYEIQLVSPTLKSQKIILPSRAITKLSTGSTRNIYTYITRYLELYADGYTHSFTLDSKLSKQAPESTWNEPTLFEVLNDLLITQDRLLTMDSFTNFTYLDLIGKGSAINSAYIQDITYEQDIEGNHDEIQSNLENAITGIPTITEWITPRTEDASVLDSDDMVIKTSKRFHDIEKVEVLITLDDDDTGVETLFFEDITDYVLPKKQWDSYKISTATGNIIGDYKRNYIWYEEGTNTIGGLSYRDSDWIPGFDVTKRSLHRVVELASGVETRQNSFSYRYIMFRVTYNAEEDIAFRTVKGNTDNANVVIDNQEDSYVDFLATSKRVQNVSARIGNETAIIRARYTDIDDVPNLKDTYGDFIMYERTLTLYENFILMEAKFGNQSLMRDLYGALKSAKRYTAIQDASEALYMNHINRTQFYLGTSDVGTTNEFTAYLMNLKRSGFEGVTLRGVVRADDGNKILANGTWIYDNKQLYYHFRAEDNHNFGITNEFEEVPLVADIVTQNYASYVDEEGEFESIRLRFTDEVITDVPINDYETDPTDYDNIQDFYFNRVQAYCKLPLIEDDSGWNYLDVAHFANGLRYKDDREIEAETYQFNFRTENVLYDEYLLKSTQLFQNGVAVAKVYASDSETYTDISAPLGIEQGSLSFTDSTITASFSGDVASWCITDSDDNVILAVNGNYTSVRLRVSGFDVLIELFATISISKEINSIEIWIDNHDRLLNTSSEIIEGQDVSHTLGSDIGLSKSFLDIDVWVDNHTRQLKVEGIINEGDDVNDELQSVIEIYHLIEDIDVWVDSHSRTLDASSVLSINYFTGIAPTINYVSKTATSITFTLTNNDGKALSIFYEIDDDTPDLDNILVGAGATSSEITLSGLSSGTTYTLYAWAYNNGTFSSLDDYEFTTTSIRTVTPTVGTVRCRNDLFGTNYIQANITNNDAETVTIYRNGVAVDTLTASQSKYIALSSTSSSPPINYDYDITAQAQNKFESFSVSISGTLSVCVA